MKELFNTIFYEPIYNGFVFFVSVVPGGDVGIAIVLATILVKFIILPLAHKSVKSQARMREIEPEVKKVKEKHKEDKQEQARQVMELYKKHGVNPFSGCLLVLVQLPVILALYWVFFKGLERVNTEILYSFVAAPAQVNMDFLGVVGMLDKSIVLAALAGITQYYLMKFSIPPQTGVDPNKKTGGLSFKEEFAKNMSTQMRYVLPVFIFVVAYTISAAVALYWTTNNLFSLTHEIIVRKKANKLLKEVR